ncbi:MAG: tRNA modification GTPase [Gemmatimonadaceae bacterium]
MPDEFDDTIAALSTAPGRGAVALLRVSGRDAFEVAGRVVRPWPLKPRQATLCALHDPATGALLDRALVTTFPAPRSYTGDDVVELATHGGAAVPASVLAALEAAGSRPALPGEFTRRAVLNRRMDLVQAEAVGDLVDARSGAMQRAALQQMDGGLSRRVEALREALLEVEALLAYDIDFPEEDDGPVARDRVTRSATAVVDRLDALLATASGGALVRDGATVVIAGPPNAGKSSLFNALLGEQRAIVTDVPGTTRDAIEALLDTRPLPLRLVDTAGLHATRDVVERLGIEVSERWLARAEVVVACGESADAVARTVARVRELTTASVIPVHTKRDLGGPGGGDMGAGWWGAIAESGADPGGDSRPDGRDSRPENGRVSAGGTPLAWGAPPENSIAPPPPSAAILPAPAGSAAPTGSPDSPDRRTVAPLPVSAETGRGLRDLLAAVQRALADRVAIPDTGVPLVTRARHQRALAEARGEVAAFVEAWREDALPAPVAAVHVRSAIGALDDLIGTVGVEDILDRVFSTFCVGK